LLLPCIAEPRERNDPRVADAVVGHALGDVKGTGEIGRNPWMTIDDVATDDDQMHDGKDASLPEIVDLEIFVVGEEPSDALVAAPEMDRHLRCDEGVDLAADQHLLIGLVTGGIFEPQPSRRLERDVLGTGQHPGHLAVRYPEKLFENALHPYA